VESWIQLGVQVGLPAALLLVAYVIGTAVEQRHYRILRARERRSRAFPVVTFREPPPDWRVEGVEMVTGSVVISLDYFKRFLAGLRLLVGGRIAGYESLLDRARREAVLRVKEEAFARGCHAVVHLRLESTRLNRTLGAEGGTAGVEILAYGTALKIARKAPR